MKISENISLNSRNVRLKDNFCIKVFHYWDIKYVVEFLPRFWISDNYDHNSVWKKYYYKLNTTLFRCHVTVPSLQKRIYVTYRIHMQSFLWNGECAGRIQYLVTLLSFVKVVGSNNKLRSPSGWDISFVTADLTWTTFGLLIGFYSMR